MIFGVDELHILASYVFSNVVYSNIIHQIHPKSKLSKSLKFTAYVSLIENKKSLTFKPHSTNNFFLMPIY